MSENENLTLIVQQHSKDIHELQCRYNELSNEQAKASTSLNFIMTAISDIKSDMKTSMNEIKKTINDELVILKNKIDELSQKPGKRWDMLITVIITAFTTGIITAIVIPLLSKGGTP